MCRAAKRSTVLQAAHPADPHRLGETLELLRFQVLTLEQVAIRRRVAALIITSPDCASSCNRAARFGVLPTTACSSSALADQVADHDEPGGDADPHLERELGAGR